MLFDEHAGPHELVFISLSGSTLVFQDEIRHASLRNVTFAEQHIASVPAVIAQVENNFPQHQLIFITPPREKSCMVAVSRRRSGQRQDRLRRRCNGYP